MANKNRFPVDAEGWHQLFQEGGLVRLDQLLELVDGSYRFDADAYPALVGTECINKSREIAIFAVRHSALHMMKSTAVVAAEAEKADHGGDIDEEVIKIALRKELVNVLKLAKVLGLSADDLVEMVATAHASRYKQNA